MPTGSISTTPHGATWALELIHHFTIVPSPGQSDQHPSPNSKLLPHPQSHALDLKVKGGHKGPDVQSRDAMNHGGE
jgi:hypothetical protein